ncbi:hypothetical protein D3C77_735660 [compost metagenome]
MGGDAPLCGEYHQVIGGDTDADILPGLVVGMAGEDRLQLTAGGQLQAIEGGGTKEGLADDRGAQVAVRCVDNVVRA